MIKLTKKGEYKLMKIVIVTHKDSNIFNKKNELMSALSEHNVSIIFRTGQENILYKLNSESPDLLISIDLEGFDMCTLTGGYAYNLLKIQQLHLLQNKSLFNSSILSSPLSLRMTFICPKESDANMLKKKFPDLPSVYSLENLPASYPFMIASKLFKVI